MGVSFASHTDTGYLKKFSLQGRTALVTGGARGCGLAFARGLAEAGANVAIFDVVSPEDAFHAIEKECGVRTAFYRVDISSQESLEDGFGNFQRDFDNALDICVPCAGINRHLPFLEFTYKDHQDLLSINVLGLYFTAQLAAKQMIANKTKHGSIILVASMASHIANIRVNTISPGFVKTEMTASFPHLLEGWKSEAMNGRIADPEDIMGACVFLASDANNEDYGESVGASTTVVVVGAGPSGLMLATNLVRFGISVLILDDRPDKTSTGKADGMQPKTIETFKQLRLADPLLKNGARVFDISFWESAANHPLRRTGRKLHYPDHLVGASDPYILLAHQGMVEEVMIDDMESRGVFVTRNGRFTSCSRVEANQLEIKYEDMETKEVHTVKADYLVGCDGARSKVRSFIPDADLEGEITNAAWGVMDGVLDTDFPDLWSKVALRSESAGSILLIPRERGMTRLYVELSSSGGERVDKAKATPEYVTQRARDAMHPFKVEWKSVEWFGTYVVGQRVAKRFMDDDAKIIIAGDAGHCHSALAAQGANTSMHDSFNLAWKLNLVSRGLAKPSLLHTYEEERQKVAYDLINFDVEHCKAFSEGEAALAKNFDDNIRFIAGIGAEYNPGMLTRASRVPCRLQPGMLQSPAKVTRYIDANPVDIQLDIPVLGQFKVYIFVPQIPSAMNALRSICQQLEDTLAKISDPASRSYQKLPHGSSPSDEFQQIQRYNSVSQAFTFGMVTKSDQSEFEITDLPQILRDSQWTLYLDNIQSPSCTERWIGDLAQGSIGMAVVRPDGYIGMVESWDDTEVANASEALEEYFSFMV
ncbi:uncharacterized protein MYU51_010421 [Penicillium brevicompactum]